MVGVIFQSREDVCTKVGGRTALEPYLPFLRHVYCSSIIGYAKPELGAFAVVMAGQPQGSDDVLYADDQERNLVVARATGMRTVLADSDGAWMAAIDQWLATSH